jgi:hypothetical protein
MDDCLLRTNTLPLLLLPDCPRAEENFQKRVAKVHSFFPISLELAGNSMSVREQWRTLGCDRQLCACLGRR